MRWRSWAARERVARWACRRADRLATGWARGGGASESLALAAGANAERALDGGGVERPHRHAGVHQRDQQCVGDQVVGVEAALHHPGEHRLLDRRPHHIGIEPDVPEEHAVGRRHGALSQTDRVRSAPAVGERRQAPLHRGRGISEGVRDIRADMDQMQPRELFGDLALAPAPRELGPLALTAPES